MHEAALARAVLPAPTICLGMLLRPLSVGHCLWLSREDKQRIDDRQSLIAAVLICSQTWAELSIMRKDRWLRLKIWLWRRRLRKMDFDAELVRFRQYMEEGSDQFPLSEVERMDRSSSPRIPGCPMMLRLHQWLMLTFRMSEEAAWDYPLAVAKMRWAAYWEQEGGLEIKNQHEVDFEKFVAEQEAKGAEALKKEDK